MEKIYRIEDAARILKRQVKTLQMWDRSGRLPAHRTATNRRYYTEEQLKLFLNQKMSAVRETRIVIAYSRVSSAAQRPDLQNQRNTLEQYNRVQGTAHVEYVDEIGGGMNFLRKEFLRILRQIEEGKVRELQVAHRDRWCRFGFEYFEKFCQDHECALTVLNQQSLSPEEEMVQDLMSIVHCFSSRLYGLRNYKKDLKRVLSHGENTGPSDTAQDHA